MRSLFSSAFVRVHPRLTCFFVKIPALLTLNILGCLPVAAQDARPNIVILYADDMGYGDLGANNPESKIPTPQLDKLASEGMRFTDGHSSSGICTPSRYALLTGRFHWRKFHNIVGAFGPPVFDNELTLPVMLKGKGYRTACIGKWHLGWNWRDIMKPDVKAGEGVNRNNPVYAPGDFDWSKPISGGPLSRGFDYYFGDDVPNFPPYAWFENDRVITVPSEPLAIAPVTKEGGWEARKGPMTPGWDFYQVVPRLGQRAVEWIGEQKGKEGPFFLYVPFNSPHAPIVPGDEFAGTSKAGGFGDFVVQTDQIAGNILRALEDNGFGNNTIVIFSADNGAEHYAYERIRRFGHSSSGPYRGCKRDLYEGGHRVPFVVRWPGRVKPGSVGKGLISQVDIMATLAELTGCGLPAGAAEDSHSMVSVLTTGAPSPRTEIVHNTNAGAYAVRRGDWILIDAKGRDGYAGYHSQAPEWYNQQLGYVKNDTPGELYNLAEDPFQKNNRYAAMTDKVNELKTLLEKIRSKGQVR